MCFLNEKNKSWSYIKNVFFKKGLSLPEYNRDIEREKANRVLIRKFGSLEQLSFKQKIKYRRFLIYRGFEESLLEELFIK